MIASSYQIFKLSFLKGTEFCFNIRKQGPLYNINKYLVNHPIIFIYPKCVFKDVCEIEEGIWKADICNWKSKICLAQQLYPL